MQQPTFDTISSTQIQEQSVAQEGNNTPPPLARIPEPARKWRDIFWLGLFIVHMIGLGFVLVILGLNRFRKVDRLKLNRFTNHDYGILQPGFQTEKFWPVYAVASALGAVFAWASLALLCVRPYSTIKVAVHSLTTYLAVISVFCFRDGQFFFGTAFAIGALLQFVYTMSVMDRLPFTTLVLSKAVKLITSVPAAMRISYPFIALLLVWLALWSFGVSGVIASGMDDNGRWLLILVLSVSLFWTGAVVCNTVHVTVAGVIVLALADDQIMPPKPILRSLQHAMTTSLGSICYGSLFTAAIRTMRWAIRGFRSRIGKNECLLCCVDFLFHLVETLVRFFNKYAYVEVAIYGKSFNHSARDAWELFQSTGIEVLIAYDLSGAILLMEILLGGLLTGTCVGIWAWFKWKERVLIIGLTAMLVGMILVGLGLVVVESAVTSLYMCYASDPSLIRRWDPEFAEQIAETLHQRLQHRSGREVAPSHSYPKSQSNVLML
ncbi:CTL-like protein DDB_G0274487 [Selaginella moellendorffii]|uniref:CTL-like protein DDB_G0274487 n=1 Tax=Selaginella moellendorffii TaxID=88036 RepID=UPI000D1CC0B2|nr:CTL-like protein DDB_G0274487 [Selaginella moellendorffii]|eukprot:XP_024545614.1 CTL-like protein DDB_G0274487 [Selaginella moellendorffii]